MDVLCDYDIAEIKKEYPSLKKTEGKSIQRVKNNLKEKRSSLFTMNTMAILDTYSQNIQEV